jgi:hypothetical protein
VTSDEDGADTRGGDGGVGDVGADHDAPGAAPPMSGGSAAEAPLLTGDDVRLGPEQTDEPQAGAAEPTD